MKELRFFCSPIITPVVELSPAETHHLLNVCRLKLGDRVELFDGAGSLAFATIAEITHRRVQLQVEEIRHLCPSAGGRVIIAVSLAKGQRFDWLIEKCTELGVDRIFPVIFERTVKLAKGKNIIQRYEALALAAAKQSRRLFLPRIDSPAPLSSALEILKNDFPAGRILLGSLSEQAKPLLPFLPGDTDVIAFVGPEGGLTEPEESLLDAFSVTTVRLTDTTLRIETAAVAFAAILSVQRDSRF